jgi:sulfur-oxidizing protein SoxY
MAGDPDALEPETSMTVREDPNSVTDEHQAQTGRVCNPRRRRLLAGAAAGALLPWLRIVPATAASESVAAAMREAFGDTQVRPGKVVLELPQLAENGTVVPLNVRVDGLAAGERVTSIHVFAEANPLPNVVQFHFGPRAAVPQVGTRIRLADSQKVVAVAALADGSLWSAAAQVVVTVGGCGD